MKNLILNLLSVSKTIVLILPLICMVQMTYAQCGDMYIAGVIDGPITGGVPKGTLLCASADIADLSIYGVGAASNGASNGIDFTFPAESALSGDCFWIAGSNGDGFMDFFGFAPCFTNGSFNINGDDPIELFCGGNVVDVFGVVGTDGTGQPWEYTDGWAVSNDMLANPTFDINEWDLSGTNALDNQTSNSTATTPFPIDTQQCPGATMPTCTATLVAGTATCDTETSGDDNYTATFTFSAGAASSYTVSVTNANGTPDATTLTGNATITVTGATEGTDVILSVIDGVDCDLMATVTTPSCDEPSGIVCPGAFINEFSYECAGDDINEAIEVCIPNTFMGSPSDLQIDLYNGNAGMASYASFTLDNFTVGADDGTNTYYSMTFPPNTLQNGPDGLALSFQGELCEFISYEGSTLTAIGGPADGIESINVGVAQSTSSDCGETIQLVNGAWVIGCATLGAINSDAPCMTNCPELTVAPVQAIITSNSECTEGTLTGGVIDAPTDPCPPGSSIEYSTDDGVNWGALPMYDQDGPAQDIITRCLCDDDMMTASPPSDAVSTMPGSCAADCDASISVFPANGNSVVPPKRN